MCNDQLRVLSALLIAFCAQYAGATEPIRPALDTYQGHVRLDPQLQEFVHQKSLRLETTKHFAIFHNESAFRAAALGGLLEDAHARFNARMDNVGLRRTDLHEPLVWFCFNERSDFVEYARMADGNAPANLDAYYSAMTNRVAFLCKFEGGQVIEDYGPERGKSHLGTDQPAPLATFEARDTLAKVTHEAVHHLCFSHGILVREVAYPLWVTEGMAVNMEYGHADEEDRYSQWRRTLRQARNVGDLLPLRDFVTLDRVDYKDLRKARSRYAQAWGFYDFICRDYADQLREYLYAMRLEPAAHSSLNTETFERAFGSLDEMAPRWAQYLEELGK
jgi:hypothetical protein